MSEINEEYNGWTNYATWRVYQEIIEDREWTEEEIEVLNEEYIDALVEKVVFEEYEEAVIKGKAGGNFGLMEDYAKAFLDNVKSPSVSMGLPPL